MPHIIIEFFNLFLGGLLAGQELLVFYGLRPALDILDERPHILLRQDLIRRLRILVPSLFVPTTLSAIALIFLNSTEPVFICRSVGLLGILVFSLATFLGTVPINKGALDWKPDAPPNNWKALVDRWERLNGIRCLGVIIAFAFFLAAAAIQLAEQGDI